jgi:hypothetical protein
MIKLTRFEQNEKNDYVSLFKGAVHRGYRTEITGCWYYKEHEFEFTLKYDEGYPVRFSDFYGIPDSLEDNFVEDFSLFLENNTIEVQMKTTSIVGKEIVGTMTMKVHPVDLPMFYIKNTFLASDTEIGYIFDCFNDHIISEWKKKRLETLI